MNSISTCILIHVALLVLRDSITVPRLRPQSQRTLGLNKLPSVPTNNQQRSLQQPTYDYVYQSSTAVNIDVDVGDYDGTTGYETDNEKINQKAKGDKVRLPPLSPPSSSTSSYSSNNSDNIERTITASTDTASNNSRRQVFLARVVSWILRKFVQSQISSSSGLQVHVDAASNQDILRGRVNKIELQFDSISYGQLQVSGGGQLVLQGIDLRMRRFLFQDMQSLRAPYRLGGDLLLSQEDILRSQFIRGLTQLLVNTILSNVLPRGSDVSPSGLLSVVVKAVSIRNRRLVATGEVFSGTTSGNGAMSFEVSLSAGVRDEGQVLFLRDIQVALNPDSALLRTSFPLPLAAPIDVDLGPDCRIDSLVISEKHVWIRFKSVISPVAPFRVAKPRRRAMYFYDLGALLSSVLRLRGGVALRWTGVVL